MRGICAELAWLTRIFHDLQVPNLEPVPLKCDSLVAIYIAKNPVYHEHTKHIQVDCHYVRQKLQGLIHLSHVLTNNQFADVFAKPLSGPKHKEAVRNLGFLSHPPNWGWGGGGVLQLTKGNFLI